MSGSLSKGWDVMSQAVAAAVGTQVLDVLGVLGWMLVVVSMWLLLRGRLEAAPAEAQRPRWVALSCGLAVVVTRWWMGPILRAVDLVLATVVAAVGG